MINIKKLEENFSFFLFHIFLVFLYVITSHFAILNHLVRSQEKPDSFMIFLESLMITIVY
jgi:hypothetical protein